jgi:hypothetical protein
MSVAKTKSRAPTGAPKKPERGVVADTDLIASFILGAGSAASRGVSALEHIDFLVSIRQENYKVMFDFWQTTGWWMTVLVAAIWGIIRFRKTGAERNAAPTIGLVLSCSFVAFVMGSIITIISSSQIPRVIVSWGGPNCQAVLDTVRLSSFRDKYKIGLICMVQDPTIDVMTDENILISNLYTIVPGMQQINVKGSIKIPDSLTPSPGMGVGYLAFVVPNEIVKEKLKTIDDINKLGGKILDPLYYR